MENQEPSVRTRSWCPRCVCRFSLMRNACFPRACLWAEHLRWLRAAHQQARVGGGCGVPQLPCPGYPMVDCGSAGAASPPYGRIQAPGRGAHLPLGEAGTQRPIPSHQASWGGSRRCLRLTGSDPGPGKLSVGQPVSRPCWVLTICQTLCQALGFTRKHSNLTSNPPCPAGQALSPSDSDLKRKPTRQRGEARVGTCMGGLTVHPGHHPYQEQ